MNWYNFAAGAATGAGAIGVVWFLLQRKPEMPIIKEVVAEKQIEVEVALTDQDLLKVPCSESYLEKRGESLCRELYCYLMTRGALGNKASAATCESITNTINKTAILSACQNDDDAKARACVEFFDRRL